MLLCFMNILLPFTNFGAMKLKLRVRWLAKLSLLFTFIVIVAGSIVRMTGSGMGCPDWPKCYGYLIPPTDSSVVTYSPGRAFQKGQMIIHSDTLWVAQSDFVAEEEFNPRFWQNYTKHDYAHFNATHTWIEYINRLSTVLFGIPVVLLVFFAWIYYRRSGDGITFGLSLGVLMMLGFEAWLGKLVVDGNLHEGAITWHMLGSLGLVFLLQLIIYRLRPTQSKLIVATSYYRMLWLFLVMAAIQVLLGTQVRESVDILADQYANRQDWVENLSVSFYVHRSFSILIAVVGLYLWWYNRIHYHLIQVTWMTIWMLVEIVIGIVLAYFAMPAYLQPMHLWLGILLFAYSMYALLLTQRKAV